MNVGTLRLTICAGLLAVFSQAIMAQDATRTAPPTPQTSVKKDCSDAKGATKAECEKVAAKIDAEVANPQPSQGPDDAKSSSDYVNHSSPAMRTPTEVAKDKARAKSDKKTESSVPPQK